MLSQAAISTRKVIAHGSSFQRFSLRSNLDTQIKSWLRGGVNFSFTDSKQVCRH